MRRKNRYLGALNRLRKSKGFGIHSPFAFHFVTRVLKERLPYYAYSHLEHCYERVLEAAKADRIPKSKILPLKDIKLMFRITNYFNPTKILQIGANYGLSANCLLSVSSKSSMNICGINPTHEELFGKLTAPLASRTQRFTRIGDCIDDYLSGCDRPFIVIDDLGEETLAIVADRMDAIINAEAVIIVSCINSTEAGARLWEETKTAITGGMTFSNGKFGVIVCNPKLPAQHFSIWL